jgi:preprotein translocase subunit SecY
MNSQQGTIVDVFNLFTGGALERFSLFALGVMPYISASIIMQLMSSAVPQLAQLKKEGSSGRQKITQYTRNFTVILAAIQEGGVAFALQGQSSVVMQPGFGFLFTAVVTLTAGTIFLMWLGEQITERGVGNGISLIIFAGIVAGLPRAVAGTLELVNTGQLSIPAVLIILALVLAVIYFIVRVERGQRRITVNYAQRQGRVAYQNQSTHLPLKVNMSGVIPAIFASSIVIFPSTLATWFSGSEGLSWLTDVSAALTPGNLAYTILYSGLIIFFCFFYTAMVFNSKETADNLKKSGAFIPGIRPGRHTADYIDFVLTRLTMVGSLYLVAVCLLPDIFRVLWSVPFYFGGTSVLIVVVVIMDFIAQIQAHLISHQYDSLMKKANLKSYGRSGVVRR